MSDFTEFNNSLFNNEALLAYQKQLSNLCSNKLTKSLASIAKSYQQPFLELQKQINAMTFPQSKMVAQMQAEYKTLIAPIQKMVNQYNKTLLSAFNESFTNSVFQKQIGNLQNDLESFSASLGSITIHDDYVSVPEILIPSDFSYEDIPVDSTDSTDKAAQTTEAVKKLSFSDALTIIGILIPSLLWLISYIYTNQQSLQNQKNYDKQIAVEAEANQMQKEENRIQKEQNQISNKQVEAIEKQTEYLMAIYVKLEEADSAFREPYSAFPNTDSAFPNTDSAPLNPANHSQCIDSQKSTDTDEPCDSDMPHKAD